MIAEKREQVKLAYICLTCGYEGSGWFVGEHPHGKCQKCSKTVWGLNIYGTMAMVQVLTKEIKTLRDRVFDLECYVEEQVDPVGGEI